MPKWFTAFLTWLSDRFPGPVAEVEGRAEDTLSTYKQRLLEVYGRHVDGEEPQPMEMFVEDAQWLRDHCQRDGLREPGMVARILDRE